MFRDDHEAARLRIETLEARLHEKEASLSAREAELAETRAELDRLRRGDDRTYPHGRPEGAGRALRVLALAALAVGSTGVALRAASSTCAVKRPCPFTTMAPSRPPAAALLPAPARLVADPPVLLLEREQGSEARSLEGCEAGQLDAADEPTRRDEPDELRPSGPGFSR